MMVSDMLNINTNKDMEHRVLTFTESGVQVVSTSYIYAHIGVLFLVLTNSPWHG